MPGNFIEVLRGGIITPLTIMEPARPDRPGRFDGGVHYSDGKICDVGTVVKANQNNEPAAIDPNALSRADGSHVFGGMLQNEHFGHFIAENLARLWAFDHLSSAYNSVAFYLRRPSAPISRFVPETLQLVIPDVAIHVVKTASSFEYLAVPQDLTKNGYTVGHPLMWGIRDRLRTFDGVRTRKIYVSRSRLPRSDGGILGDKLIDGYLEAEGYEVLYPELMSVRDQLAAYCSAERLVFAEGSALHLYSLVADPAQHVFVIWRRGKYAIFDWQIRTFGARPLYGESCVEKLWIPEREAPDAAHGKAVLNFASLSRQLHDAGFIAQSIWNEPNPSSIDDEMTEIAAKYNRRYVLKNVQ